MTNVAKLVVDMMYELDERNENTEDTKAETNMAPPELAAAGKVTAL